MPPVSCILSFVCKSVFLVQNSFKNRKPCRCPVCTYFVSTKNSILTCDSVVRSIFRAQDDDVNTEVGFTILNNLIRDRGFDCNRRVISRVCSRVINRVCTPSSAVNDIVFHPTSSRRETLKITTKVD